MAEPVPVSEVYKNLPAAPPAESKSVSVEDVYKNLPAPDAKEAPAPRKRGSDEMMATETENKRLGGSQFTSPYFHDYKDRDLGEATIDDADRVHYKDKEGKLVPADHKNHVVLKDPDSGKPHVLERSDDTNYGPILGRIMGLGGFLQEGLASTSPVTGGVGVTAAQKALQAQKAIADTTGVSVPVSRAAVEPGVAARALSHIPGVNTTFEKAAAGTAQGLERASSAAADTMGTAKTPTDAGEAARGALQSYVAPKKDGGVLAQKVGAAYDKVDALVDQTAKHPLANTMKVAQDLNTERLAMEKPDEFGSAVKEVLGAVTNPDGLTYSSLKNLRSSIGEEMAKASSDASKSELKRLYKGLSDDMRDLVGTHGGPRATQLWERANTMARAGEARRETLAKVLGNDSRSDEGTFASLMRLASTNTSADAKTLVTARKSMPPDEWSEVVAGTVARLGRTGEGTTSTFDPNKWTRDYSRISEAGKNILFGESSQLRKALDNIHELSTAWPKMANLGREPGETSHVVLVAAGLESMREGPFRLLSAITGAKAMAKFLSRPATAANVAKWMQSYKVMAITPNKANLVLLNEATNLLSKDAAEGDRDKIGAAATSAASYAKELTSKLPWAAK